MTRKLHYRIQEQDHNKSIGVFLKEKEYSRAVIIELKKTKTGIQKNGVWAGVNEVLKIGDLLEIEFTEEVSSKKIAPIKGELDILYEDEDLLVVSKPYNTPIHPSVNNYENTLANHVMHYFQKQNRPYTFRCINRLDRDTTGVTILPKHLISASILGNRMTKGSLKRTYIAFVEGITDEKGMIDLPIGRAEGSIIKRKIDEREGQQAVTHYHRIGVFEADGQAVSVVALKLETGRTHQIRVHMSAIGHPLLGDFLYNEMNKMMTRQALHGAQCGFVHPITEEELILTAPLPKDMMSLLEQWYHEHDRFYDLAAELNKIKWEV